MTENNPVPEYQYVGFLNRWAAYTIDSLFFSILQIPIMLLINSYVTLNIWWQTGISFYIWTAYWVWMTGTFGATVGKLILRIKIINEDGSSIGYGRALLRELASYLSFLIIGMGYLNILRDQKKQGWHDKIAKTLVVSVLPPDSAGQAGENYNIATIIFLFSYTPIGLLIMWFKTKWKTWIKLLVTIFFMIIFLTFIGIMAIGVLSAINPSLQIKKAGCYKQCQTSVTRDSCVAQCVSAATAGQ